MSGFCANIVLAFISGVELFDYVVDGREPVRAWLGEGESNPQNTMASVNTGSQNGLNV